MQVKFIDLAAQNVEVRDDIEREFQTIHAATQYVGGPQVTSFEEEFAAFVGAGRVVGVGSGTDALRLALLALGAGPGDEVITSPMTFIATAEAIFQTGARPVFVDVDPLTCNMSPAALRRYLEAGRWSAPNGPKAIVPVHLYGLPAAMRELGEIAQAYGLKIVEDACQAHGARIGSNGEHKRAGAMSAVGCFSFYPGKNLGAWGEAGAIATDDPEIAERVAMLRDHGRISHYAHQEYGYNARLDAMQAAVLRVKLRRLEDWNARRREIAAAYCKRFADQDLVLPVEPRDTQSCWHLFVIRSDKRDLIRTSLLVNNIECAIHYPVPLHLQPACRALGYHQGDFPISERIADTVLSLPMHPHLTNAEVGRVVEVVKQALRSNVNPILGAKREPAAKPALGANRRAAGKAATLAASSPSR